MLVDEKDGKISRVRLQLACTGATLKKHDGQMDGSDELTWLLDHSKSLRKRIMKYNCYLSLVTFIMTVLAFLLPALFLESFAERKGIYYSIMFFCEIGTVTTCFLGFKIK